MLAHIKTHVWSCMICATHLGQGCKHEGPLHSISTSRPWELLMMDVLKVCKTQDGNTCVLIIIDMLSKFAMADLMKNEEAQTVGEA